MGLSLYNKKRNFSKTKEPKGKEKDEQKCRFVVQEHHATRLHFDFRLEMHGVMKSWAVPKGPSLNPEDKRLAMMVEDHPIDYMYFQGSIPLGEYGGGEVRTWDIGTYEPVGEDTIEEQLRHGKLTFILHGKKLKGEFHMIHMHAREANAWLLFKVEDKFADPDWELERILDYGSRKEADEYFANDDEKKAKKATRASSRRSTTSRKPSTTKAASRTKTTAKKGSTKRSSGSSRTRAKKT